MVSRFLENEQAKVKDRIEATMLIISSLETEVNEKERFIKILKDGIDTKAADFTPFNKNKEDDDKIRELRNDIHILNEQIKIHKDEVANDKNLLVEFDKNLTLSYELEKAFYAIEETSLEDMVNNGEESFRMNVLLTQEQERSRIARELHDSPVQLLTALIRKLELSSKLMDSDIDGAKKELSTATSYLKDSITEMRRIIHDLRPMALDDFGLKVALQRELDNIKELYHVNTELIFNIDEDKIPSITAATIYRIIQEACSNAVKHASPTNVTVRFENEDDGITFSIVDDGIGFDTSSHIVRSEKEWYGFGMTTMKERIFLLSGKLHVRSRVGEGTHISIHVPLKESEDKDYGN